MKRIAALVALIPVVLGAEFTPLREAIEPALQSALEQSLETQGLGSLVKKKKLGVALAGISDPDCPRFAAVNGNVMMYAASLPKIAILLAAFKRIESGELELSAENEALLTSMIRNSSNQAATEMINRVGRDYIIEVLRSPEYRLYDPSFNGGLWVGKEYSKRSAFRRDPLHKLSHGATPSQVARFYYMLEAGRFVPPELTLRMKAILSDPGVHHKFVAGIEERYPGAQMYRKSGTWRQYHSDSAMIEHDGKRYVAVAMVESADGEEILRRLIVELDRLIFEVPFSCPDPDPVEAEEP